MDEHRHHEHVEGCVRCDLSRHEVETAPSAPREVLDSPEVQAEISRARAQMQHSGQEEGS